MHRRVVAECGLQRQGRANGGMVREGDARILIEQPDRVNTAGFDLPGRSAAPVGGRFTVAVVGFFMVNRTGTVEVDLVRWL
ncbi:hypothetical protein LNKW23_16030 [Paralimibaculum aggregatum]|uniref:Uncharacterized protein n=1 Tax=Paralimibaculum aggregatum TaxID=3036245 RepID=A0ABQ6LPR9_9RHOB|nr:hypothetical protein LNKW23_16030 [Limibaculum sp. NKW23]